MIFDSPVLKNLAEKYAGLPDFGVPKIVTLTRSDKLSKERDYLEDLIHRVATIKQKDWFARLTKIEDDQHIGAWFEMMLYGWLREIGAVEVEPKIAGDFPDFSIVVGNQKIVIEAKALLEPNLEKDEKLLSNYIFWTIGKIKKSFVVEILDAQSSQLPDWDEFREKIEHWLNTSPKEQYVFDDGTTKIVLQTSDFPNSNFKTVQAISSFSEAKWISSEPLKEPLREKASQHRAVRRASFPYVIALLIESDFLTAEEVAKAWVGEEVWVFDIDKNEVVDSYVDKSGIHFFGSHVRHTTVSATLVFKAEWHLDDKRRSLISWFVENPFAKIPLETNLFPTQSNYIVKERTKSGFKMGWERGKDL